MPKLKRFLLRYFPPGIILEYEVKGEQLTKTLDLLDLNARSVAGCFSATFRRFTRSNAETLTDRLIKQEPLISEKRKAQVIKLIESTVSFPSASVRFACVQN